MRGGQCCQDSDTIAGEGTSGSECHTFALDPWYLNKNLSFTSVFSFCTLKGWGSILAPHLRNEVGKKYFSRGDHSAHL